MLNRAFEIYTLSSNINLPSKNVNIRTVLGPMVNVDPSSLPANNTSISLQIFSVFRDSVKERRRFTDDEITGIATGEETKEFWKRWYFWATHSRLDPIIKKAKMRNHTVNTMIMSQSYTIS